MNVFLCDCCGDIMKELTSPKRVNVEGHDVVFFIESKAVLDKGVGQSHVCEKCSKRLIEKAFRKIDE